MSQTPKTDVTTTITRRYVYDPATQPITLAPRWGRDTIYVTSVVITRQDERPPRAEVRGVAMKADGSPGKSYRNGGTYYGKKDAPGWIAHLMDQMPTPRVTLVPPTGSQP